MAELRERLGRHHDAEIRAADADIHDVCERLARRAVNSTAVHALDEGAHLLEARTHLGHHILAVENDRPSRAVAQRGVEHGAVLRGVDLLA